MRAIDLDEIVAIDVHTHAERLPGQPQDPVTLEVLLAAARANPDVLIPFASVDPHQGKLGVRQARELMQAGVRGFKFHPNTQAFWPNDRDHYPLYEVIAEAGLIALFHSGTTGIGAGMPGGGGVKLKYSNPMLVDEVRPLVLKQNAARLFKLEPAK